MQNCNKFDGRFSLSADEYEKRSYLYTLSYTLMSEKYLVELTKFLTERNFLVNKILSNRIFWPVQTDIMIN